MTINFQQAKHNGWQKILNELQEAKWQGDIIHACCWHPDHDDQSPSSAYYPDGNAYCFSCQRKTDIYDYFKTSRNFTHTQTAEYLNGKLPENRFMPPPQPPTEPEPGNPKIKQITNETEDAYQTPIHKHLTDRNIWAADRPLPSTIQWLPDTAGVRYTTKTGKTRPYHHHNTTGAAIWLLQSIPVLPPCPDYLTSCQIQSVKLNGTADQRWSPYPLGSISHFTAYINTNTQTINIHPEGQEIWLLESPTDALALADLFLRNKISDIPAPKLITAAMGAHRLPKIADHLAKNRLPYRLFPDNDETGKTATIKTEIAIRTHLLPCHIDTRHHPHKDIGEYCATQ